MRGVQERSIGLFVWDLLFQGVNNENICTYSPRFLRGHAS